MNGLKRMLHSRRGFTLVELVVVLVILGVVGSIGVPALTGYIDNGKEKQAVSEAQACVIAATDMGAKQYANVQQTNVNASMGNGTASTNFDGWLYTDASTPEVKGDLALTEGAGQYFLHVTSKIEKGNVAATSQVSWAEKKDVKFQVIVQAGVGGKVSEMTYNTSGQVLYLVYTSVDGIQVVYTATGSTASVDADDKEISVPTPQPTAEPTPEPTATPKPEDKLKIKVIKEDSITGGKITGATLVIKQGSNTVATLDSKQSTNELELPVGEYVLHEEQAPAHYLKAEDINFSIIKEENKLKLSGSNSGIDSNNHRITMKDPPVTKKIVFWAADTDRNPIGGIALKITGKLGNRDNPDTPEKETDTYWISSSSEGHTLDIPLTPNNTYQFRIDNDKTSDSNYDTSDNVKVDIKVDANGNMTFDGVLFENGKGNYFTKTDTTDPDVTHVYLVFPKKKPSKDLILTDYDNIKITIKNLDEWPGVNLVDWNQDGPHSVPVKSGQIYYYDTPDGERKYYAITDQGLQQVDFSNHRIPTSSSLYTEEKDQITRVWTDSTIDREPFCHNEHVLETHAGDFYYHDGRLYMALGAGHSMVPRSLPTPGCSTSVWVDMSLLGYEIEISIPTVPVQIQIVDADNYNRPLTGYYVELYNPNITCSQKGQKFLESNALLYSWNVEKDAQRFNLQPGTYALTRIRNGSEQQINKQYEDLNTTITVTKQSTGADQVIKIPLHMRTKTFTATVLKQTATGSFDNVSGLCIHVVGTTVANEPYDKSFYTDSTGLVTFSLIPYGSYKFKIEKDDLPLDTKMPDFQNFTVSIDNGNPQSQQTITLWHQ